MSDEIYPTAVRGLTYTVVKTPNWDTFVQSAPNKYETRLNQTQNPIWKWRLVYDYLYNSTTSPALGAGLIYSDLETLMGFYNSRGGQFDSFLFTDPDAHAVGPAVISAVPNQAARLKLVTNGSGTYYSPIQFPMGGTTADWDNANRFYEDVTDLNGAITVYANGVLQALGVNYSVAGPGLAIPGASYMGKYLLWTAPPTAPITVAFSFYYRVKFSTDQLDFEKFMSTLWTMGGSQGRSGRGYLELESARPVAPAA